MKNSGKEMSVNLTVCDERVLERDYDLFQSLLLSLICICQSLTMFFRIYGVSL
jgi:hypothetical protein